MRLASDRGPEMRSLLMQEKTALLGVSRRFGTSWRPWEQGAVESEHREDQVLLALLIEEVFHCFPEEWSKMLPCIELIRANTPHSSHGLTPRDVSMSWSVGSPLARELVPFEVAPVNRSRTERRESSVRSCS